MKSGLRITRLKFQPIGNGHMLGLRLLGWFSDSVEFKTFHVAAALFLLCHPEKEAAHLFDDGWDAFAARVRQSADNILLSDFRRIAADLSRHLRSTVSRLRQQEGRS